MHPQLRTHVPLLLVLALMLGSCVMKSPTQLRHESFLALNEPPDLRQAQPRREGIRPDTVWHVRVYADSAYRGHTLQWENAARRRVETLSAYTREHFHARLECDSVVAWEFAVPDAGPLDASIEKLRARDAGQDADWIIAFVGPAEAQRNAYRGSVEPATRYLLVRPGAVLSDVQSAEEIRNVDSDEMARLLKERAHHRERTHLLRAWARSLGVPFDSDYGSFLAPNYDLHAASFSPASQRAIAIGLAHRGDWTREGRQAWGEAMLAEIAASAQAFAPDAAAEVRGWMGNSYRGRTP